MIIGSIRAAIFTVFIGIFLKRYSVTLGLWREKEFLQEKHFDDYKCEYLLNKNGAEDIATTSDGLAFITSGLAPYPPFIKHSAPSSIYVMDLNVSPVRLTEIEIKSTKTLNLNPHGLDLFEDGEKIYVFIVNHKKDLSGDEVEKFEYLVETNELVWIKSFVNPEALRSVNDVVAVGSDEFYCTNDMYSTHQTPILREIEHLSTLKLGSVAHCNQDKCELKTSHSIGFANGIITRTVDGKKEILVAYCYDDKIGVYDIQHNGDLRFNREIQSSPTMDNFWKAPDGSIYLAGSSHAWRFFWNKIFTDNMWPLGSEVLKLLPNSDKIEQIYFDDGDEFTMASIFVNWGDNILMGSPAQKFMACSKK